MEKKRILPRFLAPHEFVFDPGIHCEHSQGVSMTVPDESYSVRELLEKFTQGTLGPIQKQPLFDEGVNFDSDDLEKIAHMDLVDKAEVMAAIQERIAILKRKLADEKKAADFRDKEEKDLSNSMKQDFKERKSKDAAGQPRSEGFKPDKGGKE